MKALLIISLFTFLAIVGCAANQRIPASEINNDQARDQEQERYIYGGDAQIRESN